MNEHPSITCKELIDFLMDYVDGQLPPAQLQEFERHLGVCPPCRVYLDSYRKAVAMGKAAFQPATEPARADMPEGLFRAIQAARKRS